MTSSIYPTETCFSSVGWLVLSTCIQTFSVITGQWVAPSLLILRNGKAEPVGKIFRSVKVDPVSNTMTTTKSFWFANLNSDMFEQLLECFWKHRNDKHISQAVFWYIKAYKVETSEEALITLQVPLESLAWWYMVDCKQALTAAGFNSLNAGEWLRLFLTFLSIPTKIPAHFKALNEIRGDYFDGPHALVALRNYVTHPSQKNQARLKSLPLGTLEEVVSLGKFYLELAILHLVDYKGEFCSVVGENRFAPVGVPWANHN